MITRAIQNIFNSTGQILAPGAFPNALQSRAFQSFASVRGSLLNARNSADRLAFDKSQAKLKANQNNRDFLAKERDTLFGRNLAEQGRTDLSRSVDPRGTFSSLKSAGVPITQKDISSVITDAGIPKSLITQRLNDQFPVAGAPRNTGGGGQARPGINPVGVVPVPDRSTVSPNFSPGVPAETGVPGDRGGDPQALSEIVKALDLTSLNPKNIDRFNSVEQANALSRQNQGGIDPSVVNKFFDFLNPNAKEAKSREQLVNDLTISLFRDKIKGGFLDSLPGQQDKILAESRAQAEQLIPDGVDPNSTMLGAILGNLDNPVPPDGQNSGQTAGQQAGNESRGLTPTLKQLASDLGIDPTDPNNLANMAFEKIVELVSRLNNNPGQNRNDNQIGPVTIDGRVNRNRREDFKPFFEGNQSREAQALGEPGQDTIDRFRTATGLSSQGNPFEEQRKSGLATLTNTQLEFIARSIAQENFTQPLSSGESQKLKLVLEILNERGVQIGEGGNPQRRTGGGGNAPFIKNPNGPGFIPNPQRRVGGGGFTDKQRRDQPFEKVPGGFTR